MASKSKSQLTSLQIPNNPSIVAIYRWVIINGEQVLSIHPASGVNQNDKPPHGVWIFKDTSRKDYTYIARLGSNLISWTATFGCAYSDGGTLEVLEILDFDDVWKERFGWTGKDEVGGKLESGPSQEAKKVADKQVEKPSKRPKCDVTLDIPSQDQGGTRDNNGNDLLRFRIIRCLDGSEGTQQIQEELWWAKKQVPGEQYTALTDAEVVRLKFDGKIPHGN